MTRAITDTLVDPVSPVRRPPTIRQLGSDLATTAEQIVDDVLHYRCAEVSALIDRANDLICEIEDLVCNTARTHGGGGDPYDGEEDDRA